MVRNHAYQFGAINQLASTTTPFRVNRRAWGPKNLQRATKRKSLLAGKLTNGFGSVFQSVESQHLRWRGWSVCLRHLTKPKFAAPLPLFCPPNPPTSRSTPLNPCAADAHTHGRHGRQVAGRLRPIHIHPARPGCTHLAALVSSGLMLLLIHQVCSMARMPSFGLNTWSQML